MKDYFGVKKDEFEKNVHNLADWIHKYENPHTTIIVTEDGATVVSDELHIPLEVKD
jgi:hypothetical protein